MIKGQERIRLPRHFRGLSGDDTCDHMHYVCAFNSTTPSIFATRQTRIIFLLIDHFETEVRAQHWHQHLLFNLFHLTKKTALEHGCQHAAPVVNADCAPVAFWLRILCYCS